MLNMKKWISIILLCTLLCSLAAFSVVTGDLVEKETSGQVA